MYRDLFQIDRHSTKFLDPSGRQQLGDVSLYHDQNERNEARKPNSCLFLCAGKLFKASSFLIWMLGAQYWNVICRPDFSLGLPISSVAPATPQTITLRLIINFKCSAYSLELSPASSSISVTLCTVPRLVSLIYNLPLLPLLCPAHKSQTPPFFSHKFSLSWNSA